VAIAVSTICKVIAEVPGGILYSIGMPTLVAMLVLSSWSDALFVGNRCRYGY